MKPIILFCMYILIPFISFSQIERIDSILNDYERRYRMELNKSDTILIESLVTKIGQNNCKNLDSLLQKKAFSNAFIKEFSCQLIKNNICLDGLLNSVSYYNPQTNNHQCKESYPIYDAITNPSIVEKVVEYLNNSDYLENCQLLSGKEYIHIGILSDIIKKTKYFDSKNGHENSESCIKANLTILKSIYNE